MSKQPMKKILRVGVIQGGRIVEEKLVPQEEEPTERTAAEHGEFIAAIEGNGEPMVRCKQALGVQRILEGIYESAQAGAEVKV